MRFALLGEHPDGLHLARALVATGRHELATYTGGTSGAEALRQLGLRFRVIPDMEEVLADPSIAAVIVAGALDERPVQLRRALQSERHVLCVHPADQSPDIAYEAAMIQKDTGCALLPALSEALHPAITRLAEFVRAEGGPVGVLQLIEMERSTSHSSACTFEPEKHRFSLPGWDVLRALGGEVAEVSAITAEEVWRPTEPLLLTGRFEQSGLFRSSFLPNPADASCRFGLIGAAGQAELSLPGGWAGAARLSWARTSGDRGEEVWESWDPWGALIHEFEEVVLPTAERAGQGLLTWQTAVRSLELDDAARRSVQCRRVSVLEYVEATEEVGFKGTMTLVGCALLWIIVLLLILSNWVYWLGWLIVPVLVFFLGLQLLRWIVPAPQSRQHKGSASKPDPTEGPANQ
ncbi:MAG TPA: hypothetical protein VK395_20630 [Gemmataceae bacterium]|nr:hypothetical protein [Gemmataceae bacterium]